MNGLVSITYPELILAGVACALMLLGLVPKVGARRAAAGITVLTLVALFVVQTIRETGGEHTHTGAGGAIRLNEFGFYIRLLTAGVGILLALLAWPTNSDS